MPKSQLLQQVREVLRLRHYSIRTEEAYVQTIRRFILYHRKPFIIFGLCPWFGLGLIGPI